MANDDRKINVVFESRAFDLSWRDDDDQRIEPLGRDAAEYFVERLATCGAEIESSPVSGEGGWSWDIRVGKDVYCLFLHWAPIGNPVKDCWVIQPAVRKSLLLSLLGKSDSVEALAPVVRLLKSVIGTDDRLVNVRWLTLEEFDAV